MAAAWAIGAFFTKKLGVGLTFALGGGLFFFDGVSKNHYQVLGVSATAPAADIKRAYRRLAIALHPDKHGGDPRYEEQFKAVAVAYGVLSDPDRRAQYDFLLLQVARRAAELRAQPAGAATPAAPSRTPYGAPTPGPGAAPLRTRPPAGRRERHYQQRVPRQQVRFTRQDALLVAGLLALMVLFGVSVKVVMDRVTGASHYEDARRELAEGRLALAQGSLNQALGWRPGYAPALALRGQLSQDSAHNPLAARGDYEAALAADDPAPLSPAERAQLHFRLGQCQATTAAPTAADASYGRTLALDTTLAEAYLARGENRLLSLGQPRLALADLQAGRRRYDRAARPVPLAYLQAEGAALAHFGRYAEAQAAYERALAAHPSDDGRTLFLLGRLAQQRGDSALGCAFFRRGAARGYGYAVAAAAACH